ncbi:MAG TPA: DUF5666 domain-containing protein [Burkholderiaceae bacterium]|nr:DUF5666 domain-containing protein [Burkholderiaceae bacterium]
MSPRRTLFRHAVAWLLAAAVAACGGGVETGGTGPTGSAYVEGPISGFGSIVVGGIRLDDSSARVVDADGSTKSRDDLRLGMVVEVESGRIGDDGSGNRVGTASQVRVGAQLLGPVTLLDLPNSRVVVLGQRVRLTAATSLDGLAGGTAGLRIGDVVEVHGFFDASGVVANYVATRVARPATAPLAYRVRGPAREVDAGTRTLRIGAQVFDLGATGLPPGLVEGAFVRLVVQTAQSGGRWVATSAVVESRQLAERDDAELEGLVTAFTSAARWAVNGVAVDATNAAFPQGSAGLGLGVRVKVRGRATAGGVAATSVELRSDDDVYNEGIDLRDTIAALDTTAKTFALRGLTVFYGTSPPPRYDHGAEGDLANGRRVRVRATFDADRTRLTAQRIEFVNN